MTPIEKAMSEIDLTPTGAQPNDESLPYATHTGIMKIGEIEIEVNVLNDGRRIISEDALTKIFGYGWKDVLKSLSHID